MLYYITIFAGLETLSTAFIEHDYCVPGDTRDAPVSPISDTQADIAGNLLFIYISKMNI